MLDFEQFSVSLKSQQQREKGVIQKPATEREKELFKIQQEREKELFKSQQERERAMAS